jgi:hypothetical protein
MRLLHQLALFDPRWPKARSTRRWSRAGLVSEDAASRVAFDRATLVPSGGGLVRASVRTDHVDLVHDPDLHRHGVREVEADCAGRSPARPLRRLPAG